MKRYGSNVKQLNDAIQAVVQAYRILDAQAASSPTQSLTRQELYVVERISEGPAIMRDLAEHLGVAVNTVTTVVDNLENKGVVRRERAKENRRKVWVRLTDCGHGIHDAYQAEQYRTAEFLLSSLNVDEQEIFMVLMRKIGRAAVTLTDPDSAG